MANATAAEPVVQALGLNKFYGHTQVLQDISFTVERGELFGVVGPDGAGKTTLLRMLAGATGGVGEIRLWGQPAGRSAARLRERLGYVPQRFSLYGDLTVAENLRFVGRLYSMSAAEVEKEMQPLLAWAGLQPFVTRLAAQLSGGMRQKLSLIAALLHSTQLLLLDEPTTAVDPVARQEFWQMLRELCRNGTTVIISTIYLDEATGCDRLLLLHGGRALAAGSPAEIRRRLPYQVWEVNIGAGDRRQAGRLLEQQEGVRQVMTYGSRLRVQVDPEAAPLAPALKAALEEAGIASEATAAAASLEDVYAYLLAQHVGGGTA